MLLPQSVEELVAIVHDHDQIQIVGARSKPAMTPPSGDAVRCGTTRLCGIISHEPSEFLITAWAGTTIAELRDTLASHGQYLPFDPPLADPGATIGGTVAAGLSGAGRLRFGGLRDFIVGVRIVDGLGNHVTGGGNVVKNAAGYDLPKLMVGSGGYLGAITDVTLKVFPQPRSRITFHWKCKSFAAAIALQTSLSQSPIDIAALDVEPNGSVWIRIEGESTATDGVRDRLIRLQRQIDAPGDVTIVADASDVWKPLDDGSFSPPPNRLVRAVITPSKMCEIDRSLGELCVDRRYSVAGNVVWIDWPGERPIKMLDECLLHHGAPATVLTGTVPRYRLGVRGDRQMIANVKTALDPNHRFVGQP